MRSRNFRHKGTEPRTGSHPPLGRPPVPNLKQRKGSVPRFGCDLKPRGPFFGHQPPLLFGPSLTPAMGLFCQHGTCLRGPGLDVFLAGPGGFGVLEDTLGGGGSWDTPFNFLKAVEDTLPFLLPPSFPTTKLKGSNLLCPPVAEPSLELRAGPVTVALGGPPVSPALQLPPKASRSRRRSRVGAKPILAIHSRAGFSSLITQLAF